MTDDAGGTGLGRRKPEPSADATGLGARNGADSPGGADSTSLGARQGATPSPADATGLGARPGTAPATSSPGPAAGQVDSGRQQGGVVRFGPGVPPPDRPSTPTWQQATPEPASSPPERKAGRRSRRLSSLLGFLTVVVVAATLAWLLYQPSTPVLVTAVGVAPNPAEAGCDTTVDVVGTLTTDGTPGVVRYQWLRSDGVETDVLSQSVATGETSTEVRLQWTVSGEGTFEGTATLRVLEQVPVESSGSFTYSCS